MDSPHPTLHARWRRSLGYRGLGRTLKVGCALARYRLLRGARAPRPHAFDLEWGTDTTSLEFGSTIVGDPALSNGHLPIDTVDFTNLMAPLGVDYRVFTFIDFGSGQGRALMLASCHPFAAVIGIEYARELHQIAERNLAVFARRCRLQQCSQVQSVWADAALWPIPPVPTLFYICEPFKEPMMRRMVERVLQSLHASPRPAYVLYVGDGFRPLWEASGEFEIVGAHYYDRIYRWKGAPQ